MLNLIAVYQFGSYPHEIFIINRLVLETFLVSYKLVHMSNFWEATIAPISAIVVIRWMKRSVRGLLLAHLEGLTVYWLRVGKPFECDKEKINKQNFCSIVLGILSKVKGLWKKLDRFRKKTCSQMKFHHISFLLCYGCFCSWKPSGMLIRL